MEVIREGWLYKAPTRSGLRTRFKLFRSRWRRRYFVLYGPPLHIRHDGSNSAILEYYSGPSRKRKRGSIDLEFCEEVISELETRSYHHVFAIRQSDRNYLLAAMKYQDMTQWVDEICKLLGFQDNANNISKQSTETLSTAGNLSPGIGSNSDRLFNTLPPMMMSSWHGSIFQISAADSVSDVNVTLPRSENYSRWRTVTSSPDSNVGSLLNLIPPSPYRGMISPHLCHNGYDTPSQQNRYVIPVVKPLQLHSPDASAECYTVSDCNNSSNLYQVPPVYVKQCLTAYMSPSAIVGNGGVVKSCGSAAYDRPPVVVAATKSPTTVAASPQMLSDDAKATYMSPRFSYKQCAMLSTSPSSPDSTTYVNGVSPLVHYDTVPTVETNRCRGTGHVTLQNDTENSNNVNDDATDATATSTTSSTVTNSKVRATQRTRSFRRSSKNASNKPVVIQRERPVTYVSVNEPLVTSSGIDVAGQTCATSDRDESTPTQ